MKLTVLKWLGDFTISLAAKTVEVLFRIILLCLPLGLYLFIIQSRSKASSVSNLSVYTNENSVWQNVFPGFALVAINKNDLREFVNLVNTTFQQFIEKNKYTLAFIIAASIVAMMVLMYVKY